MPNSMTGFGAAEGSVIGGQMAVDVRTVNHRHFNLQTRIPYAVQHLEQTVRERVRERVARGHVNVSARWVQEPPGDQAVEVNVARARAVMDALTSLKRELALPGEVDVAFVARQPDVLLYAKGTDQPDPEPEFIALLDQAVDALLDMRKREGGALVSDLTDVLDRLDALVKAVDERAPTRLVSERARLQRAVAELLDGRRVDQDRLELELALLADRLDVAEEIVRLRTHVSASREALNATAPAGRKLAFLGQEMLRETNTIGSKANDALIAEMVIEMKGELERFREQVENLE